MKNFKLYYISEEYVDYLRQFDNKVAYNKNRTRPYVGIVYTQNNYDYFVPLHSPKEKHKRIHPKALDIYKIKDGELGVVNINNMIPAPYKVLNEVLPTVKDEKYRTLLTDQLSFLNNHKKDIYKKIKNFMLFYKKGYLSKTILDRCCDFELLEEKMKEY